MVLINNRQNLYDLNDYNDLFNNIIKQILKYENIKIDFEVSISFVNDQEIRELNYKYRKIDKVTDVLSFPMYEFKPGEEITLEDLGFSLGQEIPLGDIIISLPQAIRQSEEYGHSLKRELAYLIVHGMFHLLGYDHLDSKQKKLMREKEEKILSTLSIKR